MQRLAGFTLVHQLNRRHRKDVRRDDPRVTVSGIPPAYAGVRSTWTTLGWPLREGESNTEPTRTPRNFTSERAGRPSPMLDIVISTLTRLSSLPSDFSTIDTDKTIAIATKQAPTTKRVRFDGLRGKSRRSLACHPPNLAPDATPHSAMVSNMFAIITMVRAARIARPAATPTPAGPPLAK